MIILAAAMITVLRTDMILSLAEVIASLRESGSRAGSNRARSWAPNALKAFDPRSESDSRRGLILASG